MHTIGARGGVCPKVGWGGGGAYDRLLWFSHDVTKTIDPRFYFHDVLEQLKTNFHKKFSPQKGSWFCDRVRLNF